MKDACMDIFGGAKKLGFGLMRLPLLDENDARSVDEELLKRMIDEFLGRGFSYFDTAWTYHGGECENIVRKTLTERYPRERFTIATKMPTMLLEDGSDPERIFEEQLAKCGVEFFDYYLIHNINANSYERAKKFGCFDFVKKQKSLGRIGRIGFSFHDDAKTLDRILAERPETEFVQLQVNYLDWDNAGVQSRKCLETARRHGKPVVVMEPLKGGALAQVPESVEKIFRSYSPGTSAASWALRFAAGQEGVAVALSGMSSMEQLLDNAAVMQDLRPLSCEELKILEAAKDEIASARPVQCTACRYCVDGCPVGIPIPEYLALYNAESQSKKSAIATPQGVYYANLAKTRAKASDCLSCGRCEAACPQRVKVVGWLKKVAAAFEGGAR